MKSYHLFRKTSIAFLLILACLLALTFIMVFATSSADIAKADDTYDLWIEDVQVTSSNLSGTNWSYAPGTNTLTLDNYMFYRKTAGEVHYAPIYYTGSADLTIELEDRAWLEPYINTSSNIVAGIFSAANLTINLNYNEFTITVYSNAEYLYGIQCEGKLTINKGGYLTITTGDASVQSAGIYCQNSGGYEQNAGSVTINQNASTANAYGIYNEGSALVQGGYLTINATASTSYAYYGATANTSLTVKENLDTFTAVSAGTVNGGAGGGIINTIPGKWYTNTAGTEGTTDITKNTTPQVYSSAKKLTFSTPYMSIDTDQPDYVYYDGQAHTPIITVNKPTSGYTIKWGTEDGVYNLDSAPSYTNAGDYDIYYKVTAEGYMTAESGFTFCINKGEWTVTQNPTKKANLKYTGEPIELINPAIVEEDDAEVLYTLFDEDYDQVGPYRLSEEIPMATDVGTYHFYFEVPEDDNHELYEINFDITIEKGDYVLDVTPTPIVGLMYTGQAQELINAGSIENRTIYYKLGESGEYSETIPTATEIGKYTIYYKVLGDESYNTLEAHFEAEIIKPYVFDSFIWSSDYTTAQAKLVDLEDASDTILVPANVDSQVIAQPTCDTKGTTRYTASYLSEEETKDVANINALGHNLTHHDAVAATTEKAGNIEYWTCSVCGKYFKDSQGTQAITQQDTILARLVKEIQDTTSGVTVKINGEDIDQGFAQNVSLKVEVKTNVSVKEGTTDYASIQKLLNSDEKIKGVYDVKLILTVDGVETEIQPSDIKEGTTITVKMTIPDGVDATDFRLLHIHAANDMEFVSGYTVSGNTITFTINRLSEFAFIIKDTGSTLPGWAIALIVIGCILVSCCLCFILLFFVFNKWIKKDDKVVRAIKVGKKDDEIKLMLLNFKTEYRVKEEVYDKKKDAEDAQSPEEKALEEDATKDEAEEEDK